ncbi:MAG: gamma-glutamylcyclotransferase [Cyclobacteriaceae bacterium]
MQNQRKFTDLIFVYGALRKDSGNDVSVHLANNANYLGHGFVLGELYDIEGYPGLKLDDKNGRKIEGDIFQVDNIVDMLHELDKFEELGPEYPIPNSYTREKVEVNFKNSYLKCWVYLAQTVEGRKKIEVAV